MDTMLILFGVISLYAWASLLGIVMAPWLEAPPRSSARIGPLALGGIALGAKVLGGLFKGKGEKKKAKAVDKSARAAHGVAEGTRTNRNAASQALLKSLFGGRYAVDPTAFDQMQQAKPYTGVDPSTGMGWGMAADAAGGLGDIAMQAALMKYPEAPPEMAGPPTADIVSGPVPAPPEQFSLTPWIR